jgi:capsular polysaccharide biosynthesis protein
LDKNSHAVTSSNVLDIVRELREDVAHHEQLLNSLLAHLRQIELSLLNTKLGTSSQLPAWTCTRDQDVIGLSNLDSKVRHVEQRHDKSKDIVARIKATGIGSLYVRHLKRYAIVRELANWMWRNVYPIYVNHIATYLSNTKGKRWRRLTKLNEYVIAKRVTSIQVANAALVETPVPDVLPACDQGYLESPHDRYDFPHIYVATISDGMIYGGSNLVLANEEVICHDLYDFERDYTSEELHGRNLIDARKGRIRWLLHDESPEHMPAAAAFVDACAINYAHWLTEVLPRIAAFCSHEKFKDIPIVVNDGLHKNIMESLFLVVGEGREIVTLPIGRALQVNALYLTSVAGYVPFERRNNNLSGHSHGLFSPIAFELIRNKVGSFAERLPEQAWPEKIYLRRNSGARKVTNAAELEELLAAQGFIIVEPEKLTFLQQAKLFMNAKEIISPTGAALSNAIFCKPGTRLGVLMAKHVNMICRYWLNMLAPLKINVSYVLGEIVNNHDLGIHADFSVDRSSVIELLKSWQSK